ncbi:SUKH-4 family immunity protein [Streptomyces sp. NPDC056049]|uniref:SUKH-4 family immunity protein n=1 Tax=Streptomyces sp. NPDC056049 TaxID=3345693 RepID=UPI0035E132C8
MTDADALVLGERDLPAGLVHETTRRLLTTGGLPARHPLMRFRPVAEARVPTVREHLAERGAAADELPDALAGLLIVGRPTADGDEADEIVVDGGTGRVSTLWLYEKDPPSARVTPFAPSLEALAGFLAGFSATMASFTARPAEARGPAAVEEATRTLLACFADADWDEGTDWGEGRSLPAYWRILARIRPLALIAGVGGGAAGAGESEGGADGEGDDGGARGGLRLALPPGLLDAEFDGAAELVRFTPDELPGALTHAPTRRFLVETGLPADADLFSLWQDEWKLRAPAGGRPLICLGGLGDYDLEAVLDGDTGVLYHRAYDGEELTPLNTDVSTLLFALWLYRREQRIDAVEEFTDGSYLHLAEAMTAALASVDPLACAPASGFDDFRYWPEVFHDEAGGVL